MTASTKACLRLLTLVLLMGCGLAMATGPYNERDAKPQANVEDKDGIWVLDVRFKDPRLITVDIPGRGRRVVWYLWYQVINYTNEPRVFIPDFELVTLDKNTVHHDQILPSALEAIRRIEDPTGYLDIKNSVTMAAKPIPPSKRDAVPTAITGIATWDDVNPDANRYSIFISGLSNGWTEVDQKTAEGKSLVRRKTLQLNFKRLGDRFFQNSQEIRFVPPAEWIYRASTLAAPVKQATPNDTPAEKKAGAQAQPITLPPLSAAPVKPR
jgi:hypothetical protein